MRYAADPEPRKQSTQLEGAVSNLSSRDIDGGEIRKARIEFGSRATCRDINHTCKSTIVNHVQKKSTNLYGPDSAL